MASMNTSTTRHTHHCPRPCTRPLAEALLLVWPPSVGAAGACASARTRREAAAAAGVAGVGVRSDGGGERGGTRRSSSCAKHCLACIAGQTPCAETLGVATVCPPLPASSGRRTAGLTGGASGASALCCSRSGAAARVTTAERSMIQSGVAGRAAGAGGGVVGAVVSRGEASFRGHGGQRAAAAAKRSGGAGGKKLTGRPRCQRAALPTLVVASQRLGLQAGQFLPEGFWQLGRGWVRT